MALRQFCAVIQRFWWVLTTFLGHISTGRKLTKKAKMGLAIKNLFQNLKKSTFKLQRPEFFLGRLLGQPYQPKHSTSQKLAEKAKNLLVIRILYQNLKKSTFKLQQPEFFLGRLLGLPYQPKRSFIVQKYFEKSKNAKIWFLNYKKLSFMVRPIKSKIFEIAWQNGPKVHSGHFGPARAANSIFRGFFTSST